MHSIQVSKWAITHEMLRSVIWINAKWDSTGRSHHIMLAYKAQIWPALIWAFSIWFWLNDSTLCDALAFMFDRNPPMSIWLWSDTYRMCSFETQIVRFHVSCIFLMLYSIKKRYVYIIPFIVYFKWVLMTGFFLFWICSWPSAVPGIFFSKPYTMHRQQPSLKIRFFPSSSFTNFSNTHVLKVRSGVRQA